MCTSCRCLEIPSTPNSVHDSECKDISTDAGRTARQQRTDERNDIFQCFSGSILQSSVMPQLNHNNIVFVLFKFFLSCLVTVCVTPLSVIYIVLILNYCTAPNACYITVELFKSMAVLAHQNWGCYAFKPKAVVVLLIYSFISYRAPKPIIISTLITVI